MTPEEKLEQTRLVDKIGEQLGYKYDTRYHWRSRGQVPHYLRLPMIRFAEQNDLQLNQDVFEDLEKVIWYQK